MIEQNNTQRIIDEVFAECYKYKTGYSVTLNMLINDPIHQDIQIEKLIHWLNVYCYGNNFKLKRNKKRLYTVGASEVGTANQGLHMHLIIMHNNDTQRTDQDIEKFIRKKWCRLINTNSIASRYGNLIDLRVTDDIGGWVGYIVKTCNYLGKEFNFQYY